MRLASWRKLHAAYRASEEWLRKRNARRDLVRGRNYGRLRCERCHTFDGPFDCHHLRYPPPHLLGTEPISWLRIYCRDCHEEVHNRRPSREEERARREDEYFPPTIDEESAEYKAATTPEALAELRAYMAKKGTK